MSDANSVSVGIIKESVWGTTPTTPAFQNLRITGAPDLAYKPTSEASDEIRSDRNVIDTSLLDQEAGGSVNFEVSYDSLDDLIEGALFSSWENTTEIAGDTNITDVVASTDTFTVLSGTNSFVQYHLCKSSGFTEAGNNQVFAVASSTGTTVVAPSSPGLTDEASPPATAKLKAVGFVAAAAADITAAAGGLASSTLDFTTIPELEVGLWVKIGGSTSGSQFATTALNGWARISAVAANALTFDVKPTGWTTDAGTGKTIQVFFGDRIENGTTKNSYSISERFLDHSPVTYQLFTGMLVNTFSLSARAAARLTGSAAYLGKDVSISNSDVASATHVAASTTSVLNSTSNVGALYLNETAVTTPNYIMEATINIANNLRRNLAVQVLGACSIGAGECSITGTLNMYFGDKTFVDYLQAQTELSLSMVFTDSANDCALVVDIPRIKLTSGNPAVPGKNQEVMTNFGFQGLYYSTLAYAISIQRLPYVPV